MECRPAREWRITLSLIRPTVQRLRRPSVAACTPLLKQLQIDGLAHRLVAGIVWMKVVAAVVGGGNRARMSRIRDDAVEVDEAVEGAARAYPVVHGQAFGLLFGREISLIGASREGIFERRQRAAD